jgi:hypothetical protein
VYKNSNHRDCAAQHIALIALFSATIDRFNFLFKIKMPSPPFKYSLERLLL